MKKPKLPPQALYTVSAVILLLTDSAFISLMLYSLCFGASFGRLSEHAKAVTKLRPSAYSSGAVCCICVFIYIAVSYASGVRTDGHLPAFCVYYMLISQSDDTKTGIYEQAVFSLQGITAGAVGVISAVSFNSIKEGIYSFFCVLLLTASARVILSRKAALINNLLNRRSCT